jgi:pyruvate,water dikinase
MRRFGNRAQYWQMSATTPNETPEVVLDTIRSFMRGGESPKQRFRQQQAVRMQTLRTLRGRLTGKPALLQPFEALASDAGAYSRIREGMALRQLTAIGVARGLLLRAGARLVKRHVIETPSDILFMRADEVDGGSSVSAAEVAGRRAEWQRWSRVRPPESIGGRDAAVEKAAPSSQLKGIGVSRGVVTGTARVLTDVDEASRLAAGDILVCRMTSPAWTPSPVPSRYRRRCV